MNMPRAALTLTVIIALTIAGCSPAVIDEPQASATLATTEPATTATRTPTPLTRSQIDSTGHAIRTLTEIAGTETVEANVAGTATAQIPLTATVGAAAAATAAALTEADIPSLPSPISWGEEPYSRQQLSEVYVCFANRTPEKRYPPEITIDLLPSYYQPITTCDWALLANAYAERALIPIDEYENEFKLEPVPLYGRYAYALAVSQNPAYVLGSGALFVVFSEEVSLIEPPPLSADIVSIEYDYHVGAQGGYTDENISIIQGNTRPIAYTTGISHSFDEPEPTSWSHTGYPSAASVQALKEALTHLVPVALRPDVQMGGPACGEWGMSWSALIRLSDGTEITAQSATSYVVTGAGPTYFEFDFADYERYTPDGFLQNSPRFLQALTALLTEANPYAEAGAWQPVGQPFCAWEYFHPIDTGFNWEQ